MLFIALIFAFILRIPASDEDDVLKEIKKASALPLDLDGGVRSLHFGRRPPRAAEVAVAHRHYMSECRMKSLFFDILVYAAILVWLFATVYLMSDPQSIKQTEQLANLFRLPVWDADYAIKNVYKACFLHTCIFAPFCVASSAYEICS